MSGSFLELQKIPHPKKRKKKNPTKKPPKNKQKRSNNLQKKGFYNLETASGFSVLQIRP
jgi:hypothetical protein